MYLLPSQQYLSSVARGFGCVPTTEPAIFVECGKRLRLCTYYRASNICRVWQEASAVYLLPSQQYLSSVARGFGYVPTTEPAIFVECGKRLRLCTYYRASNICRVWQEASAVYLLPSQQYLSSVARGFGYVPTTEPAIFVECGKRLRLCTYYRASNICRVWQEASAVYLLPSQQYLSSVARGFGCVPTTEPAIFVECGKRLRLCTYYRASNICRVWQEASAMYLLPSQQYLSSVARGFGYVPTTEPAIFVECGKRLRLCTYYRASNICRVWQEASAMYLLPSQQYLSSVARGFGYVPTTEPAIFVECGKRLRLCTYYRASNICRVWQEASAVYLLPSQQYLSSVARGFGYVPTTEPAIFVECGKRLRLCTYYRASNICRVWQEASAMYLLPSQQYLSSVARGFGYVPTTEPAIFVECGKRLRLCTYYRASNICRVWQEASAVYLLPSQQYLSSVARGFGYVPTTEPAIFVECGKRLRLCTYYRASNICRVWQEASAMYLLPSQQYLSSVARGFGYVPTTEPAIFVECGKRLRLCTYYRASNICRVWQEASAMYLLPSQQYLSSVARGFGYVPTTEPAIFVECGKRLRLCTYYRASNICRVWQEALAVYLLPSQQYLSSVARGFGYVPTTEPAIFVECGKRLRLCTYYRASNICRVWQEASAMYLLPSQQYLSSVARGFGYVPTTEPAIFVECGKRLRLCTYYRASNICRVWQEASAVYLLPSQQYLSSVARGFGYVPTTEPAIFVECGKRLRLCTYYRASNICRVWQEASAMYLLPSQQYLSSVARGFGCVPTTEPAIFVECGKRLRLCTYYRASNICRVWQEASAMYLLPSQQYLSSVARGFGYVPTTKPAIFVECGKRLRLCTYYRASNICRVWQEASAVYLLPSQQYLSSVARGFGCVPTTEPAIFVECGKRLRLCTYYRASNICRVWQEASAMYLLPSQQYLSSVARGFGYVPTTEPAIFVECGKRLRLCTYYRASNICRVWQEASAMYLLPSQQYLSSVARGFGCVPTTEPAIFVECGKRLRLCTYYRASNICRVWQEASAVYLLPSQQYLSSVARGFGYVPTTEPAIFVECGKRLRLCTYYRASNICRVWQEASAMYLLPSQQYLSSVARGFGCVPTTEP